MHKMIEKNITEKKIFFLKKMITSNFCREVLAEWQSTSPMKGVYKWINA